MVAHLQRVSERRATAESATAVGRRLPVERARIVSLPRAYAGNLRPVVHHSGRERAGFIVGLAGRWVEIEPAETDHATVREFAKDNNMQIWIERVSMGEPGAV